MVATLKEGEKIKVNGKLATIIYVNRLIKCYQVNFSDKRSALIPFDQVEAIDEPKRNIS